MNICKCSVVAEGTDQWVRMSVTRNEIELICLCIPLADHGEVDKVIEV